MRVAEIYRETKETKVKVKVNLDGTGKYNINTGISFFNHMLELFSAHSLVDLEIEARGDIEVDLHHTVEDVGIVLGSCILEALGEKKGIRRYGYSIVPMDEVLVAVAIDICGRPLAVIDKKIKNKGKVGEFDLELVEEFFRGFVNGSKTVIHVVVIRDGNKHHLAEAIFKGFALALSMAVEINPRRNELPSTKGLL